MSDKKIRNGGGIILDEAGKLHLKPIRYPKFLMICVYLSQLKLALIKTLFVWPTPLMNTLLTQILKR